MKNLITKKNLIVLFAILFLGNMSLLHAQTSTNEVKRLLTRAKTAYGLGEYEDALNEYKKVQAMAPNFPDIYKAMGDVYEKLGGDQDLKNAMDSYKRYLQLSPKAVDKEELTEKIDKLEYLWEKQVKRTEILNDFSGIWISDLKTKDKNIPSFVFRISEIANEGRYRVEILPLSGFYKESFIQKIVGITPDKKNNVVFTLADAQVYNPSSAKYDWLNFGIGLITDNSFVQTATSIGLDAAKEKDLPTNTQTAYNFKLRYVNGELQGYCIIQQLFHKDSHIDKTTQDDYFEITLRKDNAYFNKLQTEAVVTEKGYFTDISGKYLTNEQIKERLKEYPELYKEYKQGYNTAVIGINASIYGSISLLVGLIGLACDDENFVPVALIGAGVTVIGVPMVISGRKAHKRAAQKYNEKKDKATSYYDVNFGITPSGGLGLVVNF